MSVSPSKGAKFFESVFTKHAKDLDLVCTAPFDSLKNLCGVDEKGAFGNINGKKTYPLGEEGLEAKDKERADKKWTVILTTAAVTTAISVPIFGALLILGITAIIICLHHVHRYSTFQKHLLNESCIVIQQLICIGVVEQFTPLNSVNPIPRFIFYPETPKARQYYIDIMHASLCEKSDPKLDAYIKAHREQRLETLPFAYIAPAAAAAAVPPASAVVADHSIEDVGEQFDFDEEDREPLAPAPKSVVTEAVLGQEVDAGYIDPNAGAGAPQDSQIA